MSAHTAGPRFTPAPWRVVPGNIPAIFACDDTVRVAMVCMMPGQLNTAQNADLIAAAPELYDALRELWGFVEDLQKSNPGYLGKLCLQDYVRMNRALGLAPAALAKAGVES